MEKQQTKARVAVSCRIDPELRAQLQEEADNCELSLSAYIETLLDHRQIGEHCNPYLCDEIDELEAENERLRSQLAELQQVEKSDDDENDSPANAEIQNLLEKLNETYPDRTPNELLLAALQTALLNSKNNFFIYSISDVWQQPELKQTLFQSK